MNLDTSYYNCEKTEYTVDHRTVVSSSALGTHNPNVKNEMGGQGGGPDENTHYEIGTHVPDNNNFRHTVPGQSQATHFTMNNYGGQQTMNNSTVCVDVDEAANTFVDRKVIKHQYEIKNEGDPHPQPAGMMGPPPPPHHQQMYQQQHHQNQMHQGYH